MELKQHLDSLDGDNKKRTHDFVSHVVNALRMAVQASDIQRVRDIADELEQHRDMCVDAITGTGPSHDGRTQTATAAVQTQAATASAEQARQREEAATSRRRDEAASATRREEAAAANRRNTEE